MSKQHVTDLLSDKISSTFLTLIDESEYGSSLLWECLINQCANKRSCLIIQSGTHTYSSNLSNHTNVSFINTSQYENSTDLLHSIRNRDSTRSNSGSTGYLFIDSLNWFLLDYPCTECDFDCWIQQLLMSILVNCGHESGPNRLVLRFQPVRDISGRYGAGSDEILKLLESVSTSLVRCGDVPSVLGQTQVGQDLEVWHRRSVQGEWSKSVDHNLFLFNKPAWYESGQLVMDSLKQVILDFILKSKDIKSVLQDVTINPHTTFDLSLSESEREARSRVVLPYEIPQAQSGDLVSVAKGECQIHYTPDCFDDLDDEDPDDDLDI